MEGFYFCFMAFFRITVKTVDNKTHKGIREMNADIDTAYRHFCKKLQVGYRGTSIKTFEIVQLSKLSDEVKRYLERPKRPPIEEIL